MDSAPSHVVSKTAQWLVEHKVRYIPKQHWMVNWLDLSRMDFAVNAIFERHLNARKMTGKKQLLRRIRAVWKSFERGIIRRALLFWKTLVNLMINKLGYQLEQDLYIFVECPIYNKIINVHRHDTDTCS